MAEGYYGEIRLFAGTRIPRNWRLCDGSLLPISENPELYSVMGANYGGNGVTTFGIPDLRGRVPIGSGQSAGTSFYRMGEKGGYEQIVLHETQMPTHSHSATSDLETAQTASNTTATDVTPSANSILAEGNYPTGKSGKQDVNMYTSDNSNLTHLQSSKIDGTVGIGNTGGSQPHENRQPFNTVNFMICIEGLYPSPN